HRLSPQTLQRLGLRADGTESDLGLGASLLLRPGRPLPLRPETGSLAHLWHADARLDRSTRPPETPAAAVAGPVAGSTGRRDALHPRVDDGCPVTGFRRDRPSERSAGTSGDPASCF